MHNREDSGKKRLNCGHQEYSEKRLNCGHQEYSIPDDLLTNILITLSVEDVMRCSCVCRRWRYLTSTSCFLDLFSQNSVPVTLFEVDETKGGSKKFMLKNWWRSESASSAISRFDNHPGYRIQCSRDGLLVLKSQLQSLEEFIVVNPVCFKDKVTIFVPKGLFSCTEACAIYFHPTLKDYCILWRLYSQGIRYMISSLGSNSWREIENEWEHYVWDPDNLAVLVNQYMYWLIELGERTSGIMEFDILSEEFKVIPLPSYPHRHLFYEDSYLLRVRGILSFFLISHWEKRIYQWTLIDRTEELWTTSIHSIRTMDERLAYQLCRVIALVDEELLVVLSKAGLGKPDEKRLVAINPKLGTTRTLGKDYYAFVEFFPYQITSVSLRNYKPKIRMKENGWKDAKSWTLLNGFLKWGSKKKRSKNGVK